MPSQEDHDHRPRPDDHLVEPMYVGLGTGREEVRPGFLARLGAFLRRLSGRRGSPREHGP